MTKSTPEIVAAVIEMFAVRNKQLDNTIRELCEKRDKLVKSLHQKNVRQARNIFGRKLKIKRYPYVGDLTAHVQVCSEFHPNFTINMGLTKEQQEQVGVIDIEIRDARRVRSRVLPIINIMEAYNKNDLLTELVEMVRKAGQ
jgi:hypothetical protein